MYAPRLAQLILLVSMALLSLGQSVRTVPVSDIPEGVQTGHVADHAAGLTAEPILASAGILPSAFRTASVASEVPVSPSSSVRFAERVSGQQVTSERAPAGPRPASLSRHILRVYRC
jgi:hypothetical protein